MVSEVPRVVPAECMVYLTPLFLSTRWTSATSFDTEAVGVPIGMRQKSRFPYGGKHMCLLDDPFWGGEGRDCVDVPARHADGVGSF